MWGWEVCVGGEGCVWGEWCVCVGERCVYGERGLCVYHDIIKFITFLKNLLISTFCNNL